MGTDGGGVISESEFAAAAPPPGGAAASSEDEEEETSTLFSSLDLDGDGTIESSELEAARTQVEMSITELFDSLDSDDDGDVSKSEFDSSSFVNAVLKAYSGGSPSDDTLSSIAAASSTISLVG